MNLKTAVRTKNSVFRIMKINSLNEKFDQRFMHLLSGHRNVSNFLSFCVLASVFFILLRNLG
jgi:hypothetical protein